MAMKKTTVPEDKLRLYEKLINTLDGIDTKSNFGAAYTAVNGNMYSMISKHGVVGIRLPAAEREAFLVRYASELFRGDPSWPPAKEYVAAPDALLEDTDTLAPYLRLSYEYASSLKPKVSKAKKTA